jgi:hypothetical protein
LASDDDVEDVVADAKVKIVIKVKGGAGQMGNVPAVVLQGGSGQVLPVPPQVLSQVPLPVVQNVNFNLVTKSSVLNL